MKIILIALILAYAIPAMPTDAQACGGWWDPCCKWWEPSSCPAPLKQRAKDASGMAVRYLGNADAFLKTVSFASCSSMVFGATILAMGPACVTSGAGDLVASIGGFVADQIQRDPYTDQWPYDYEGGDWPSLAEVGVESWTGYWWADKIIDNAQAMIFYLDFVQESIDRVNSCYNDMGLNGPLDQCFHQLERVNWGNSQLGSRMRDSADALRMILADHQDGVDINMISIINDVINVVDYFGWELGQ